MLKIKKSSLSKEEFIMTSSIQRDINFSWASIYELILGDFKNKKVVCFIDPKVYSLNIAKWKGLEESHKNFSILPTNVTEKDKSLVSLVACLERVENIGLSRRGDILMAVGGGVLMDMVSLAANLYRRGVPVIKVPTTLLGFVDASIGIKTGINFLGVRNRLGSYYLNYDVIFDTSFLSTISSELIREGMGEIFKIAIIKSAELFKLIEDNIDSIFDPKFFQSQAGSKIISLSVRLMLEELHDNPTETDLKRCVDFGHSFSPLVEMKSLEMKSVPSIPHGIAVGADCLITSIISFNRGFIDKLDINRILEIGKIIDFEPNHILYKRDDIMWSSMMEMTEHRAGNQNLPIPTGIGEYTFLQDITFDELKNAAKIFRKINKKNNLKL
ncbi:sedoheptulose 7-phosphate cyclase [Gammaproteobacteria bacterium]|nr:sedoheptulose 7-phosphate cyclase [Gammaproteobacteria bacterium]